MLYQCLTDTHRSEIPPAGLFIGKGEYIRVTSSLPDCFTEDRLVPPSTWVPAKFAEVPDKGQAAVYEGAPFSEC